VFPASGNPPAQQQQPMAQNHHLIPPQQQIGSIQNQHPQHMVQKTQHLPISQQTSVLMSPDAPLPQNEHQLLMSGQPMGRNINAQEQQNSPSTKLYYSPQDNTFQSHSPNVVTMAGSPQQAQQLQHQISSNSEPISNLHSPLPTQSIQQTQLSCQQQPNVYSQMYHQQNNQQSNNPNFTISGVPGHISTPTESSVALMNMNLGAQSSPVQRNPIQQAPQQAINSFQQQTNVQDSIVQQSGLQTQTVNSGQQQILTQKQVQPQQTVLEKVQAPQVSKMRHKCLKLLYKEMESFCIQTR